MRKSPLVVLALLVPLASANELCPAPLRVHTSDVSASAYLRDLNWLKDIFERAGCHLQIEHDDNESFSRILRSLEEGKRDLATGLSFTAERENYLYYSVSYTSDRLFIYSPRNKKSVWQGKSPEQLLGAGATLIIPMNGWYGDDFERFRKSPHRKNRLLNYANDPEGLRLLQNHPDALLIMSARVLSSLGNAKLKSALIALSPPLFEDPLHIVFSKHSVSEAEFQHLNHAIENALKAGLRPEHYSDVRP